jgi:hypothetical protein
VIAVVIFSVFFELALRVQVGKKERKGTLQNNVASPTILAPRIRPFKAYCPGPYSVLSGTQCVGQTIYISGKQCLISLKEKASV